jgi:hypothetical protein
MRNVAVKNVEKIKTHFVFSNFFFFSKIVPFMTMWKNVVEPDRPRVTQWLIRIAWYILRSQTQAQNMQHLLFSHCNNCYTNTPQCYVIRTLPVLFVSSLPASYPCRLSRNPGLITAVIERIYVLRCGNFFINLRRQKQA